MIQYNLYKGTKGPMPGKKTGWGVLQFSFKPPILSDNFKKEKEGVIFVNATSSTAPDVYDWSKESKFIFAMGLPDLGKIIRFFVAGRADEQFSLYHDPDKGKENEGSRNKSMSFYTKDGCLNGCIVTCSMKSGSSTVSHKIPVSGDEVIILKNLFEAAIPAILGWNQPVSVISEGEK